MLIISMGLLHMNWYKKKKKKKKNYLWKCWWRLGKKGKNGKQCLPIVSLIFFSPKTLQTKWSRSIEVYWRSNFINYKGVHAIVYNWKPLVATSYHAIMWLGKVPSHKQLVQEHILAMLSKMMQMHVLLAITKCVIMAIVTFNL